VINDFMAHSFGLKQGKFRNKGKAGRVERCSFFSRSRQLSVAAGDAGGSRAIDYKLDMEGAGGAASLKNVHRSASNPAATANVARADSASDQCTPIKLPNRPTEMPLRARKPRGAEARVAHRRKRPLGG
jgi:hypothetical protein